MLAESDKKNLPINHHFQKSNFNIHLQLTLHQNQQLLFLITLQHIQNTNLVFQCSIDEEKMQNNSHFRFFETPSNLFYEMWEARDDLRVSEYGQIQFYVNFGRGKAKYPVTILTNKKGIDEKRIIEKEIALAKKIQERSALYKKVSEGNLLRLQKMAELDRLKRENKEGLKRLNQAKLKYELQQKETRFCEAAKQELLNFMKKEMENKSK